MSIPKGYIRVSARRPCPICGKPDLCLVAVSGEYAGCARTPTGCDTYENQPVMVASRLPTWRFTLGGATHRLDSRLAVAAALSRSYIDAAAIHAQLRRAATIDRVIEEAERLGVSTIALEDLGIGWHKGYDAFSFPMRDEGGKIIGIRLRCPVQASKFSVKGSRNGLFIPASHDHAAAAVIVEGPTDCAAAIDWGLNAIGRPSSSACVEMTVAFVAGREWVILANCDEAKERPDGSVFYPGQEGAAALAGELSKHSDGKVVFPTNGHKDARAWKNAGATRARVDAVIRNTPYWRAA